MARFLVSLAYGGKKYAELITALDEQNAIDFGANKCIEVAAKDTGKSINEIAHYINEDYKLNGYVPFSAEIVH